MKIAPLVNLCVPASIKNIYDPKQFENTTSSRQTQSIKTTSLFSFYSRGLAEIFLSVALKRESCLPSNKLIIKLKQRSAKFSPAISFIMRSWIIHCRGESVSGTFLSILTRSQLLLAQFNRERTFLDTCEKYESFVYSDFIMMFHFKQVSTQLQMPVLNLHSKRSLCFHIFS